MLKRYWVRCLALLVLCALVSGQSGSCAGPVAGLDDMPGDVLGGGAPLGGAGGGAGGGGGGGAGGSFVGVWRTSYYDPFGGYTEAEMVLQSNGNFSKQSAAAIGSLVTITGPYSVDFPSAGMLRLTIYHGEPTEFCGPVQCTPIEYPAGEVYTYQFLDNNTLQLTDFYCTEGQGFPCTVTYYRAG